MNGEKGYPGVCDATKSLLNFWFNTDHMDLNIILLKENR